ncbi:MAG: AI-2E family transporter [Clostridiales bacterium]|nr:AI-2E family transporter [Clostridiales bacterium]
MPKNKKNPYLRLMLALFGAAALTIVFFFLLFRADTVRNTIHVILNVLMPFIIGGVLAYILTPACNLLEEKLSQLLKNRKKGASLAKSLSVALTLLLALAIVCILLLMVVPTLVQTIYSILVQIPDSIQEFEDWILVYAGDNETLENYIVEISEAVSESLPNWLNDTVLPNLKTMIGGFSAGVTGILGGVYNLLIGIIVSIYLLGSRKTFARQARKLVYSMFHRRWANAIIAEVQYADRMFSGFIRGRLLDSLIIGVICFVGMLILQIPNPMLISVIVGVTNIIPFFGPYIGAIPSFLLILMTSPVKSVIFLVFVLVLQQFDGNILGPRILGNVTGLSSFWVLFSILLFGGLFGFIGMIIGVPVFAVIYDVIRKLVNKGEAYRKAQA